MGRATALSATELIGLEPYFRLNPSQDIGLIYFARQCSARNVSKVIGGSGDTNLRYGGDKFLLPDKRPNLRDCDGIVNANKGNCKQWAKPSE